MINKNAFEDLFNKNDPLFQLTSKEYIIGVLKFGSYLSILNNKKLNASGLFVQILQDKKLRDMFIAVTESENMKSALLGLLQLYPVLLKSKNTKRLFKKSIK
jgi:hypothetical protein